MKLLRRTCLRFSRVPEEFLYLQQTLEDSQGKAWPMTGILDGAGYRTGWLQRFGYVTLHSLEDSAYLRSGEVVAATSFTAGTVPRTDKPV